MAWKKEPYPAAPLEHHPHVWEFIETLAGIYVNGGAVLRSFRATDNLDVATHGSNPSIQAFLTSPSVVAALPELEIEVPLQTPPEFHERSPFGMEGDLTSILLRPGAYKQFQGTVEQARSQSRRFMEAMFGDTFHKSISVAHSQTPWTAWFGCDFWADTFVVRDSRNGLVVLLCISDTD